MTDKESFEHVTEWLKEVDKHSPPEETIRMLIGNKSDETKSRQVTAEDIKNFTKTTGIPVIETSAKLGTKIEEAFSTITRKLIILKGDKDKLGQRSGVKISDKTKNQSAIGCCK